MAYNELTDPKSCGCKLEEVNIINIVVAIGGRIHDEVFKVDLQHMTLIVKATQKQLIDRALIEAGWGPVVRFDSHIRYHHGIVVEYPTRNGPID